MPRSSICLIIFACLWCVGTWATDGVKGGHRPGHHGGTNTSHNGLCYKTVPYSHVLALNSSGSPYNTIPQPSGGGEPHNDDWITILDCCDGYKRNVTSGLCEPHCDRGCFGGRCTAPNTCSCQPGWRSEEGVCMPICIRQCQPNAYCFSPEVCMCKLGYDDVNGQCKPICDRCVSWKQECVAPHVCRCKPGYVMNERRNECEPVCEGGCVHGVCTEPGICNCNEGYVTPPGDRENCVPFCSYCEGKCIAPNVCECRPGQTRDSRGNCIEQTLPTTTPRSSSQCGYGYAVHPDTGRCYPVSTTLPQHECRYGCGTHGVCVGPNRCACQSGYAIDADLGRCVPVMTTPVNATATCRYGCGPHGRCVASNVCACETGFRNDPDSGICIRHHDGSGGDASSGGPNDCQYPCLNGQCTGPNQCTCNHGYTHDPRDHTRSRCIAHCPGGCPNGVCTTPNFCICNPGYRKEGGVKGRQRCVPSYE